MVRIKSNRQLSLWLNGEVRYKATSLQALRRYLNRLGRNYTEIVIAGEYIGSLACLPNIGIRGPDPYFYLLTNLDAPSQAGEVYERNYLIECCFKHLKSNGFNLEEQGLDKPHQVEIVTTLLVLLYTVCVVLASKSSRHWFRQVKNRKQRHTK